MVNKKLLRAFLLVASAIVQIHAEGEGCETTSNKQCKFPFKTACVTSNGDKCIFPFTYKDVKYEACTLVDGGSREWCSIGVDSSGNHIKGKFGYCIMEVCKNPKEQKEHNGCVPATNEGQEGKGWCAVTVTTEGIFDSWGYCKDPKCAGAAAAPAAPAAGATNPLIGCGSCVAFGVVPSAIYCFTNGTSVGETFLKKFDASCLIKKCLCALLVTSNATMAINILAIIGLCVRP